MRRLLRSPWLFYGLAALLLAAGIYSQLEIHVPSRPEASIDALADLRQRNDVNVVFLLVDTLRADHLGAYGYPRDTTPMLDQLAQYGIRFAKVRAQSTWTKASMASLWMASYPATTGVTRYNHAIPDSARMPAEILRDAGFLTGGIFRNGWVAANFGFAQGFDLYVRPTPNRTPERYESARKGQYSLQGTDVDITEAASEFLRTNAASRFFLYLHYMDVHQYVYEENFAKFGTAYKDAYDNALRWTDYNVGMLVKVLEEQGLMDKTILVIAADHGEAFLEHGREGHAQDLYTEVTSVPLILSLPFRLRQPVVVEPRVRNLDIWPTLLDILGLPAMEGVEGRSLVPLIEASARGEAVDGLAPPENIAYLDRTWGLADAEPVPLVAVEADGRRLFYTPPSTDKSELYDLAVDPGEHHDIATEELAQRDALAVKARAYLTLEPATPAADVKMNALQLEQLRALGYAMDGKDEPKKEPANAPAPGAK